MDAAKKAAAQKVVVFALLVVFMGAVYRSLSSLRPHPAAAVAPAPVDQTLSAGLPAAIDRFHQQIDVVERQLTQSANDKPAPVDTVSYNAASSRDPMTSLLPKPEPAAMSAAGGPGGMAEQAAPPLPPRPPEVNVEGVIWGGSRPQALIGGKLYEIGDMIGGARIVAIDHSGIQISFAGSTFSLTTAAAAMAPDHTTAWP